MKEIRIDQKPLSINEAWQGKRFKTSKYKRYERDLLLQLPKKITIPKMISIHFHFGFSNKLSDIDNPVKPLLDILQKKYGFNDSQVYELQVTKTITEKGKDFIRIWIDSVIPF